MLSNIFAGLTDNLIESPTRRQGLSDIGESVGCSWPEDGVLRAS